MEERVQFPTRDSAWVGLQGRCDETTGQCRCEEPFTGDACERLACPGETAGSSCSGHGRCLSLRDAAATVDGMSLLWKRSYTLWDADSIAGCVCDSGFTGHDCSARSCPLGDDPLKTAAESRLPAVQTVSCTCPGGSGCSGYMILSLAGVTSGPIYANATAMTVNEDRTSVWGGTGTAESVESKLSQMLGRDIVRTVTMSAGSLCHPTATTASTTAITFINGAGDLPQLSVEFSGTLLAVAAGAAAPTVTVAYTRRATTVAEACSHRGSCDTASGSCLCNAGFSQSDGDGGSGEFGDCGYKLPTYDITAAGCATSVTGTACSGHGTCSGAPQYRCTCARGWLGGSCSQRTCPLGVAWHDEASSDDRAHGKVMCSGAGTCDLSTGECRCRAGFAGAACDRMECPRDRSGRQCHGRGRCLSQRALAGQSRLTRGAGEIQTLVCTLSSGTFELTFRHARTAPIASSATAAQLRDALETLFPVKLLEVVFEPDRGTVCSGAGETTYIHFLENAGDLPLIETSVPLSMTVTEFRPGSLVAYGDRVGYAPTWDADAMHGCHCDGYPDFNRTTDGLSFVGKYVGPSCDDRSCPFGVDPNGAQPARFAILRPCGSTALTISVNSVATTGLTLASSAAQIAAGLEALSTVETAVATIPSGCGGTEAIRIWLTSKQQSLTVQATGLTVTAEGSIVGNENQTLSCTTSAAGSAAGSLRLAFRGQRTASIAWNAAASAVKAALEALPAIGFVTVTFGGSATTLCPSAASTTHTAIIAFAEPGDLQMLQTESQSLTGATLSVAETDKGTTTAIAECSGRGRCNRQLGVCECHPGYTSLGARGDCGALDGLMMAS